MPVNSFTIHTFESYKTKNFRGSVSDLELAGLLIPLFSSTLSFSILRRKNKIRQTQLFFYLLYARLHVSTF